MNSPSRHVVATRIARQGELRVRRGLAMAALTAAILAALLLLLLPPGGAV